MSASIRDKLSRMRSLCAFGYSRRLLSLWHTAAGAKASAKASSETAAKAVLSAAAAAAAAADVSAAASMNSATVCVKEEFAGSAATKRALPSCEQRVPTVPLEVSDCAE